MVQVTVPPTLIVVTGVPLASSCHLKLEPFTEAVAGPVGVGVVGAVGVAVGVVGVVVVVGVAVAVAVGLALLGPWLGSQEVLTRSKTVANANPSIFSMVFLLTWSALTNRRLLRGKVTVLNAQASQEFKTAQSLSPHIQFVKSIDSIFRL